MKAEIQMWLGGFELGMAEEMEWEKCKTLGCFVFVGWCSCFKVNSRIYTSEGCMKRLERLGYSKCLGASPLAMFLSSFGH